MGSISFHFFVILFRTIMTNIIGAISTIYLLIKILGIMTALDPSTAQITIFTTFETKNPDFYCSIGPQM